MSYNFHKINNSRHKMFTKNQHAPIDSICNMCYSSYRTKKGRNKTVKQMDYCEIFITSKFGRNKVNKHIKGEMTYVNA